MPGNAAGWIGSSIAMVRHRAESLDTVAAMLDAGVDVERALEIAAGQTDGRTSVGLAAARRRLRRGTPIGVAMHRSGSIQRHERPLFEALAEVGRLEAALCIVAEQLRRQARTGERIRNGLLLPAAILVVATLTLPLPELAAGELSPGGYLCNLARSLLPLGIVGLLGFRHAPLVARLVQDWRAGSGRPGPAWRERLFTGLGALLSSGVAPDRALQVIATSTPGAPARRLALASGAIRRGRPVAPALLDAGLIHSSTDAAMLDTAEQAGRLPQALTHRCRQLSEDLERRRDIIAEWTPRIAYAAVVGVIVVGLL